MATAEEFIGGASSRMDKSVEHARNEFNTVRTGRASSGLLDRITVDYYGTPTPLKQLATINVPEPRMLTIQPFDPSSIKATKVDGVYDSDPRKNPNARRYAEVTFTDALRQDLGVMDATAFALCRDNELPILVFDMTKRGNIQRVVRGDIVGTRIVKDDQQTRFAGA